MKSYFIKLCWKNIWRNKRRTTITALAIAMGVMFLVSIHNYYDGFHEQIIGNVIRYHSGHLILSAKDYPENGTPNLYLEATKKFEDWLNREPEIESWSKRVLIQGLVSTAHGSANVMFMGVDPEKEKKVTAYAGNLKKGEFLTDTARKGIVIGKKLADLLHADVGMKIVALTQGVDGSIGNELFRVEGIFETQSEADKNLAFVPIEGARGLASMQPDAAHQFSILLKSDDSLDKVKAQYESLFPTNANSAPKEPKLFTWKEVQKHITGMIELDRAFNRLLMLIILGVAALGIANSVLMSILERTREFGVMLAIGTYRREVVLMVIVETLLLCVVGVAVGNLLALLLTSYFGYTGFDLRWLSPNGLQIDGAIIQSVSYPKMHWINSLRVTLSVLGLSLLVSVVPTRILSKLTPVKALRAI